MIAIGSRAIQHYFEDFKREPSDYDYLVSDEVTAKQLKAQKKAGDVYMEYLVIPPLYNYADKTKEFLEPDLMYTLKMSHCFWDFKWEKHVFDIQFLKSKGCKLIMTLFNELYQFWNEYHGENKRSDLQMSAADFFNNDLKEYDHDALHYLLVPSPTFLKILKDGAEVDVCEDKFNKLSHDEKLELVREEVYVMAYERLGGRNYRVAYSWMLKKFIMNHAPIWEAIFILENFVELHKPNIDYKQKLDYELSRDSCEA